MYRNRRISLVLVFLIVINLITPNISLAFNDSEADFEKIDKKILERFEKDDYVEGIVYLNQYDIEDVKDKTRTEKVEFLKEFSKNSQDRIITYLDKELEKGGVIEYKSYFIINGIYVKANREVFENISKYSNVKSIYENEKIKPTIVESENGDYDSNNLKDNNWNLKNIKADKVWEKYGLKGKDVVVGIIDSGVDYNHESLKTKWRGYNPENPENPISEGNWFDATSDNSKIPYDDIENPHGTHVTGIILGSTKEEKIGVAPEAKWIAAKALNKDGGFSDWLLDAGEWMVNPMGDPELAPDIINNSWGGNSVGSDGKNEWYRQMVKTWRALDILPVFASGNERFLNVAQSKSIAVPANYPESFAVGAVNKNNKLASFSQRGPSPYGDRIKPEIVAPGVNIYSAKYGGGYIELSGTSMAAPHISGIAALLLSANKDISIDELESIITSTAMPLTDNVYLKSPNYGYGYGLVDAFKASEKILKNSKEAIIKGNVLKELDKNNNIDINIDNYKDLYNKKDNFKMRVKVESKVTIDEMFFLVDKDKYDGNLINGNRLNGIYEFVLPKSLINNNSLEGTIEVKDIVDNSRKKEVKQNFKKGLPINTGVYDLIGNIDEWDLNNGWKYSRLSHSESNFSDKELLNLSASSVDNYVAETPLLDLSNVNEDLLQLRMSHLRILDLNGKDSIKLEIQEKGKGWETVYSDRRMFENYWDNVGYFNETVLDLTKYKGKQIKIRFILDKNINSEKSEWYIRSLKLESIPNIPKVVKNIEIKNHPLGALISWRKSREGDIEKYKIYRSENNVYKLIGETDNNNFIDDNLKLHVNYNYKVTAVNKWGKESPISNTMFSSIMKTVNEDVLFSSIYQNDRKKINFRGLWQYGKPINVYPKENFLGDGVLGTKVNDKYVDIGKESELFFDINIPKEGKTFLSFNSFIDTGYNITDYGILRISLLDEEGRVIEENQHGKYKTKYDMTELFNIIPTNLFWEDENLDISNYSGNKIRVSFIFNSKGKNDVNSGWYIDNINVYNINEKIKGNKSSLIYNFNYDIRNYKEKDTDDDLLKYVSRDKKLVPAEALVSVFRNNKLLSKTKVNLNTGEYLLKSYIFDSLEELTLKVEAKGYNPIERKVNIEEGYNELNFLLKDPINNEISGKLIDKLNNKPIRDAEIILTGNGKVLKSLSDSNGKYKLEDIFPGNYNLFIKHSDYETYVSKVKINNNKKIDLGVQKLKNKYLYLFEEKEDMGIIYDSIVSKSNKDNPGVLMRISPNKAGSLKGVKVFFDDDKEVLSGNDKVNIFIMSTGYYNTPKDIISIPKAFKIKRGEWNYFDLSNQSIEVNEDFYIFVGHKTSWEYAPKIGLDNSVDYEKRGLLSYNGSFYEIESISGKKGLPMIRALIDYKSPKAVIINKGDIEKETSSDKVNLKINSIYDGDVSIIKNGKLVKKIYKFKEVNNIELELDDGDNSIIILSNINGEDILTDKINIMKNSTSEKDSNEEKPKEGEDYTQEDFERDRNKVLLENLKEKIIELSNINKNDFTKKSYQTLEEKLKHGENLLREGSRDNKELELAIEELTKAFKNLEKKEKLTFKFNDLDNHRWAREDIEKLRSIGIIKGRSEDIFDPNSKMTRAEFSTLIIRTENYLNLNLKDTKSEATDFFLDINKNDWYYQYVNDAYIKGLIKGYEDRKFYPMRYITREEICVIVDRLLNHKIDYKYDKLAEYKDGNLISHWAKDSVNRLLSIEIIKGYDNNLLKGYSEITRAEAAVIISRLLEYKNK